MIKNHQDTINRLMERNKLILDECAQNILAKDLIIKEYQADQTLIS